MMLKDEATIALTGIKGGWGIMMALNKCQDALGGRRMEIASLGWKAK